MRTKKLLFSMLAVVLLTACAQQNPTANVSRVLKLEELTWTDIANLDREKTIWFLTFGNMEQHGPHLPVGSDYFQAVGVRDGLIERLRTKHPDFMFVLFPVIPLGEGGANDVALELDHPGTYAVRFETLRSVAIDIGSAIARKGFRNLFLIHGHGSPLHNIAFTEAAAFVSEQRGAHMVNITSHVFAEGFYSDAVMEKHLGRSWQQRIGFEGHAGAGETSANLATRPGLVRPEYKELPPFVAADMAAFMNTYANKQLWRGYWGAPSEASAALGRDLIADFVSRSERIAEMALAGEDLSQLPVYPQRGAGSAAAQVVGKNIEERYSSDAAEIQEWLAQRQR
jgi:creatinine amidohydrolase/Fe(II)-dependent formamide hydrolase-like protein